MEAPEPGPLLDALGARYDIRRSEAVHGYVRSRLQGRTLDDGRDVVVKVLWEGLVDRLGAERILELLDGCDYHHPGILPVLDSGAVEGAVYYVSPRPAGETVREQLERLGRLPVDTAVEMALDVAELLEHIHRQDALYLDLRPEHIVLRDGSAVLPDIWLPPVIDAARRSGWVDDLVRVSVPYVSPEQQTYFATPGPSSDVFALGCILFESIVGEHPVWKISKRRLVPRLSEPPPRVATRRRGVPPSVDAAVARAMAWHPDDRFPTAAAFADALRDPWFGQPP